MTDPFEFLRRQAQVEQWQSATKDVAALTKVVFDAMSAAGFSQDMAERLTLAWFDMAVHTAPGATK